MKYWITLVALLMIGATPALGEFESGNVLLSECQSESVQEQVFCYGYIAGVSDMLVSGPGRQVIQAADEGWYCPPPTATLGQLVAVVVRLIEAVPEVRHHSANSLVSAALIETFPCP